MATQETIDKAVNEYGIVNAADMSDEQLKSEMKAIDDQAKPAKDETAKAKTTSGSRTATTTADKTASDKTDTSADKPPGRRRVFGNRR